MNVNSREEDITWAILYGRSDDSLGRPQQAQWPLRQPQQLQQQQRTSLTKKFSISKYEIASSGTELSWSRGLYN